MIYRYNILMMKMVIWFIEMVIIFMLCIYVVVNVIISISIVY